MKEKVKKWKRRWKKLDSYDQAYFKADFVILLEGLVLLIFGRGVGFTIMCWMINNILLRTAYMSRIRIRKYWSYRNGRERQDRLDRDEIWEVRGENAKLKFDNNRLHSDYKKLEYDYNQLKKSINPKKKKK